VGCASVRVGLAPSHSVLARRWVLRNASHILPHSHVPSVSCLCRPCPRYAPPQLPLPLRTYTHRVCICTRAVVISPYELTQVGRVSVSPSLWALYLSHAVRLPLSLCAVRLSCRAHASLTHSLTLSLCVVLDYRLAPEHPFPAALDDALGAYAWLLSADGARVPSSSVAIMGDSAGGGLTMATLVAVRDQQRLPLPACAVGLSPWVDLLVSLPSWTENARTDYLPRPTAGALDMPLFYAGSVVRLSLSLIVCMFWVMHRACLPMSPCAYVLHACVSWTGQRSRSLLCTL
jgi:hypothetical protein